MHYKTILITGGAGFIGSNFVEYFVKKYPHYCIINLDKLTYAGNLANLTDIENADNYVFIKGDICDRKLVESLFEKYTIEGVVHFAAESHVDNSIKGPYEFIKTNIEGTFHLLEAARASWKEKPECRFHHISTDEVYGTLGETGLFHETTAYAPNSPYSASKASSDFLVRAYHHTYKLNVTTSNCSNNYGPKQHAEKLIPVIIQKALLNQPIPIYGDGKNIRDWLYVTDHCEAIDLIYHKGISGETYNVGGKNELENTQVAYTLCKLLDKIQPRNDGKSYESLIAFVKDRPGHDRRYAIDCTKIEKELSWVPKENFETGIIKTLNYYLQSDKAHA